MAKLIALPGEFPPHRRSEEADIATVRLGPVAAPAMLLVRLDWGLAIENTGTRAQVDGTPGGLGVDRATGRRLSY